MGGEHFVWSKYLTVGRGPWNLRTFRNFEFYIRVNGKKQINRNKNGFSYYSLELAKKKVQSIHTNRIEDAFVGYKFENARAKAIGTRALGRNEQKYHI